MTIVELSRKAASHHRFGDETDAARFFNTSPSRVRLLADVLPGCWRCGPLVRFDKRVAAEYAAKQVIASVGVKGAS
ncbi:MAG: hypothetical protein WDN46_12470 [Methylocella sp.]